MEKEISAFITYLHNVKNTSGNTEMSYKRDLEKVLHFMASRGITEVRDVKAQDLSDYVKYLEENKFAAATVSRNIASLKAFYHYMMQEGLVEEDFADKLKAPKIEKKAPEIMSPDEVVRLLEQPSGNSPKEIRDKAMLELLYATGNRSRRKLTVLQKPHIVRQILRFHILRLTDAPRLHKMRYLFQIPSIRHLRIPGSILHIM